MLYARLRLHQVHGGRGAGERVRVTGKVQTASRLAVSVRSSSCTLVPTALNDCLSSDRGSAIGDAITCRCSSFQMNDCAHGRDRFQCQQLVAVHWRCSNIDVTTSTLLQSFPVVRNTMTTQTMSPLDRVHHPSSRLSTDRSVLTSISTLGSSTATHLVQHSPCLHSDVYSYDAHRSVACGSRALSVHQGADGQRR